ncbi:NRDE family protein [Spirosoma litoris]
MCTATFLPRPDGGFILTHSRDEQTIRPTALLPKTYFHYDQDAECRPLVYPKDPQGGGTWIATSAFTTVCLLNGGFKAHQPMPPYGSGQPKHSRGLVPLHVFDYDTIDEFLERYDPTGLEPFTLLLAQMTGTLAAGSPASRLIEVRWTGRRLFINDKDPDRPHIWSSATLYAPDIIEKREGWFHDWLYQHPQPTVEQIRHFHRYAGDGDNYNAIRMNRNNGLMTLSLTSIIHEDETVTMRYYDFIQQQSTEQHLTQPAYAIA